MADVFSKEKRSSIMGRIQGMNTKPEILVRSLLHCKGYRFRLHRSDLPGRPDIVLPKYNTVIFVHGCYWHRHTGCKRGKSMPATNVSFWKKKFDGTVKRDGQVVRMLKKLGWQVLTIWECETKHPDKLRKQLILN